MPYTDPARQAEYQRRWMSQRRQAWFDENGPCVDCGSSEDLEVDHVDRTQKVTHRVWSWSAKRRAAELAKCVVRCASCHKRKSAAEALRGEDIRNCVLTWEQVREIRATYAKGDTSFAKLATRYGVAKSTIRRAVVGENWKDFAVA